MKTITGSALVLGAVVCLLVPAAAQTPVGALAIDERQGDEYGWAVDYETAAAAGTRALSECGSGCSVVLTFGRCAAYAADQDADSTAVGWAESFASADGARQAALGECGSRGGTGCIVRVWGATATWWRTGWVSTVRRAVRFRRACGRRGSIRAAPTGCSGRVRV